MTKLLTCTAALMITGMSAMALALSSAQAERKCFVYRSAITGKLVTKAYAQNNPDTTVRSQIKCRGKVSQ